MNKYDKMDYTEFVSHLKENNKHAHTHGFKKPMKLDKCWLYNINPDLHPASKEVINLKSGKIYKSLKSACLDLEIKYSTILSKISLNGKGKNDTDLMYLSELKELPNEIKITIGNKEFSFKSELENKWISIESEDDLPKVPDFYWCRDNNGAIHQIHYEDIKVGYSTHYQHIIKPQPPIY